MDGSRFFLCNFHDVSEHGARLQVEDTNAIPDEVMLMLAGPRGAKRHCRVVWRNDDSIGVSFVPKPRDDGDLSIR